MAKNKFVLSTHVIDESKEFFNEDFSGFLFDMKGGYFITCSCGFTESTNAPSNICPSCKKKLHRMYKNRNLSNNYKFNKTYLRHVDSNHIEVGTKEGILSYDSSIGEYIFKVNEYSEAVATIYPPNIKILPPSVGKKIDTYSSRYIITRMLSASEFKAYEVCCNGMYIRSEEEMNEVFKIFVNKGWNHDDVINNAELYTAFLEVCKTKPSSVKSINTLEEFLMFLGANKETTEFFLKHKVDIKWVRAFDLSQAVFVYNFFTSGEIPHSKYFLDLFNRGLMSFSECKSITETYSALNKGTLRLCKMDKLGVYMNDYGTNITVDKSLAEIFIQFCKKFCNRNISVTKEFILRTSSLVEIGAPLIYENYVDKQYYSLINSTKFLYNGDDFEKKFEKNPLDCLEFMK